MQAEFKPAGAHLVGSTPCDTAEESFRIAMENLGNHLKRLPDGEVGERDTWIRWQNKRIGQSEQMRVSDVENIYVPFRPYEVVPGTTYADDIKFPNLGYGDAAIASYAVFEKLLREGVISGDKRFMVGLPTPLSVAVFYVEPSSRELFEQAYGRALGQELDKILAAIPSDRLAIQWEVVSEFGLLEGLMNNHLADNMLDTITTRLARLVDLLPSNVEAGIHLCYGDSGHKHFIEPTDAGHLVDVTNGIAAKVSRAISWIHMPVPRERDDANYFAPLSGLRLGDETELYLGLVHMTGGVQDTRRRLAAASAVISDFGIATECGLGRRSRETIPGLLGIHQELCG